MGDMDTTNTAELLEAWERLVSKLQPTDIKNFDTDAVGGHIWFRLEPPLLAQAIEALRELANTIVLNDDEGLAIHADPIERAREIIGAYDAIQRLKSLMPKEFSNNA